MKRYAICFLLILSCAFTSKSNNQTDKSSITLKEFISFFEQRTNPDSIDKEIGKRKWIYVSSEKHGTAQVDMWLYEVYYHDVQYILQSIFDNQKTDFRSNQIQLHFQHRQPYEDFVAQFVGEGLNQTKQEKKDGIYIAQYRNDKYFVYTVMDRSNRMPYRVTLSKLP